MKVIQVSELRRFQCVLPEFPLSHFNTIAMQKNKNRLDGAMLVETSWEVCNKVGGIYTVLSTKAAELKKQFGDKLIFIGPDVWTEDHPSPDFIERKTLLKSAANKLSLPFGISIRVGRWEVPGKPVAILVKYDSVMPELDSIFGEMWNDYGVDSLNGYDDYRPSCAFAIAAAEVIMALAKHLGQNPENLIAHFDEWTTGMGLLLLKKNMPKAATVFTTHATSIGRSIASNGKNLYQYFTGYNGDQMARELNMVAKHSLEKAAAHQADCFTTVSEVTAKECTQLLEITPQVVTPNGFNNSLVPKGNNYTVAHNKSREKLLKIASALTGRDFGPDTVIVATSGRNEYRNKGIDLYIDSMVRLGNNLLNNVDEPKQILALILVPAWVAGPNAPLLDKLNGVDNGPINPDFTTHRLNNEGNDAIFQRLLQLSESMQASPVSFVYAPCYLDGKDGVIDLTYYEVLTGVDVTLFPSYYEPWGYTPLESVAFGVPTATTSLSGFGQWASAHFPDGFLESGVLTVNRSDTDYDECAGVLAKALEQVSQYTPKEKTKASAQAKKTASKASWNLFIQYYFEAYRYALENKQK